jgi:hypothetical protein
MGDGCGTAGQDLRCRRWPPATPLLRSGRFTKNMLGAKAQVNAQYGEQLDAARRSRDADLRRLMDPDEGPMFTLDANILVSCVAGCTIQRCRLNGGPSDLSAFFLC